MALTALLVAAAAPSSAQNRPATQTQPAARTLATSGAGTVATGLIFGRPNEVSELSDGRLLVNDPGTRRVVLLDAALANPIVALDSASDGSSKSYGRAPGTLMYFMADSSIFFDATSQSFVVIDPAGKAGRVMASPIPAALVNAILASTYSFPLYAPSRGLLYAGLKPNPLGAIGTVLPPPGTTVDDSSAMLVAHFDRRGLDTIAAVRRESYRSVTPTGGLTIVSPLYPIVDEWSGFPDGTIGVLRGTDLRLEIYPVNGPRRVTAKVPFEWHRLDDDKKKHIADSITAARLKIYNDRIAAIAARGADPAAAARAAAARDAAMAAGGVAAAGGVGGGAARGVAGGPLVVGATPLPPTPFDPTTLPDYFPAFVKGAMRGDLEGNFWLRLAPPAAGAPNLYLVINQQAVIVGRITVPEGTNIIGFGRSGAVYLSAADGPSARIIKTRWK